MKTCLAADRLAALQMTNAASESARSEIARRAAEQAKAAEDAAAKAALVRNFPSLQPAPSPAPPPCELLVHGKLNAVPCQVCLDAQVQRQATPNLLSANIDDRKKVLYGSQAAGKARMLRLQRLKAWRQPSQMMNLSRCNLAMRQRSQGLLHPALLAQRCCSIAALQCTPSLELAVSS